MTKYIDLEGLKEFKKKADSTYLVNKNSVPITNTINLTTETAITLAAKYAKVSNNSVQFYVIADSSGTIPSSETRVNINSSITTLVGAEGANVGDMFIVGKLSLKPVYQIIPLNDAKASNSNYKGTNGVVTPEDKATLNKVSSIETTANNALNHLPTYTESNMNNALSRGVYPWCTLGRPANSTGAYTLVTIHTTTKDNANYDTIEQTAYGREGELGRIYKRIIFKNDSETQYGDWILIGNSNSKLDINTVIYPKNVTTDPFSFWRDTVQSIGEKLEVGESTSLLVLDECYPDYRTSELSAQQIGYINAYWCDTSGGDKYLLVNNYYKIGDLWSNTLARITHIYKHEGNNALFVWPYGLRVEIEEPIKEYEWREKVSSYISSLDKIKHQLSLSPATKVVCRKPLSLNSVNHPIVYFSHRPSIMLTAASLNDKFRIYLNNVIVTSQGNDGYCINNNHYTVFNSVDNTWTLVKSMSTNVIKAIFVLPGDSTIKYSSLGYLYKVSSIETVENIKEIRITTSKPEHYNSDTTNPHLRIYNDHIVSSTTLGRDNIIDKETGDFKKTSLDNRRLKASRLGSYTYQFFYWRKKKKRRRVYSTEPSTSKRANIGKSTYKWVSCFNPKCFDKPNKGGLYKVITRYKGIVVDTSIYKRTMIKYNKTTSPSKKYFKIERMN